MPGLAGPRRARDGNRVSALPVPGSVSVLVWSRQSLCGAQLLVSTAWVCVTLWAVGRAVDHGSGPDPRELTASQRGKTELAQRIRTQTSKDSASACFADVAQQD